ncbi:hypothetical protein BN439_1107 [Erwinia amylovora Ea644]|nr:hypothetical protein BN439_1107 [Erwinia amylovora Ea644]
MTRRAYSTIAYWNPLQEPGNGTLFSRGWLIVRNAPSSLIQKLPGTSFIAS